MTQQEKSDQHRLGVPSLVYAMTAQAHRLSPATCVQLALTLPTSQY